MPGLAGGGTVSLGSANYAGRHLRQSNSLLYVETVPDAAGRADATYYLD